MAAATLVLLLYPLILFLLWPLIQGHEVEALAGGGSKKEKILLDRKEQAVLALKELEFDLQTRKISEEEYEVAQERLKNEAIQALKDIDTYQAHKPQQHHPAKKKHH